LYTLWDLSTSELQEMLALRGLDYSLDEWPGLEMLLELESLPGDLPDDDHAVNGVDAGVEEADITHAHATLAARLLAYERELSLETAAEDYAAANDDDEDWGLQGGASVGAAAGATWQIGDGDAASSSARGAASRGEVRGEVPDELQESVAILKEQKACDILVLPIRENIGIGQYLVIATCDNTRTLWATAELLLATLRRDRVKVLGEGPSIEGNKGDEWLVLDGSMVVFSLFMPSARKLYNLEELWGSHTNRSDGDRYTLHTKRYDDDDFDEEFDDEDRWDVFDWEEEEEEEEDIDVEDTKQMTRNPPS
jgi:ribosome silencing factor RsfS/YbeB/iojap